MVCTFFNDSREQCKLIDLGRIENGNTPSTSVKEYYSEEGMLWVNLQLCIGHFLQLNLREPFHFYIMQFLPTYTVPKND